LHYNVGECVFCLYSRTYIHTYRFYWYVAARGWIKHTHIKKQKNTRPTAREGTPLPILLDSLAFGARHASPRIPVISTPMCLPCVSKCWPNYLHVLPWFGWRFILSTVLVENLWMSIYDFYSASALLAMETAVIATADMSVHLSVRHVPVFCPDE